ASGAIMSGANDDAEPCSPPLPPSKGVDPRRQADIDAEKRRVQALVEQEKEKTRERERRDREEQERIKQMLELEEREERERRRREVEEETERLRRQYGVQDQRPPPMPERRPRSPQS